MRRHRSPLQALEWSALVAAGVVVLALGVQARSPWETAFGALGVVVGLLLLSQGSA